MSNGTVDRPSILVVDDCDESREILTILLSPLDAEIEQARTGEDAISKLSGLKPALVLLDVNMPGISGFEVCQQMRANPETEDITVLFISALGDLESKLKGLTGGGVDYIAKPFEPAEVRARVSTQLELYRLRSELVQRNAELEALLKEKDRFMDLAAHRLRHPLLQIRGLVGLLRSGQLGESGRTTLVDTIARAAETMNHTLNDVLEVHDLEAGTLTLHPVQVSVRKIVEESLELWNHRAESRAVQLKVELSDVPEATYDKEKLTQVLETLLADAINTAPSGSTLSIKLESAETAFRLIVSGVDGEWFQTAYAGLGGKDCEFSSRAMSNSIVDKLVRHFGGSILLEAGKLIMELPLDTGFSQESSNNDKGN